MANLTKTVSNSLRVFGPADTNNWGEMLWGDNWAYDGSDLVTSTRKVIAYSLGLSQTLATQIDYHLTVSNTLSLSGDMARESLTDQNGYDYYFPDENAEHRPSSGYTSIADTDTTYSPVSEPSTSWTSQ